VRIYSAASEEAWRARGFLKDWVGEGFLSDAQYHEFRTTNIFLRLVLFFFTLIIVAAAAGLFFVVFLSHAGDKDTGIFILILGLRKRSLSARLAFSAWESPAPLRMEWSSPRSSQAPSPRSGYGIASGCGTHFPPR
jgi:hypothetical protein